MRGAPLKQGRRLHDRVTCTATFVLHDQLGAVTQPGANFRFRFRANDHHGRGGCELCSEFEAVGEQRFAGQGV